MHQECTRITISFFFEEPRFEYCMVSKKYLSDWNQCKKCQTVYRAIIEFFELERILEIIRSHPFIFQAKKLTTREENCLPRIIGTQWTGPWAFPWGSLRGTSRWSPQCVASFSLIGRVGSHSMKHDQVTVLSTCFEEFYCPISISDNLAQLPFHPLNFFASPLSLCFGICEKRPNNTDKHIWIWKRTRVISLLLGIELGFALLFLSLLLVVWEIICLLHIHTLSKKNPKTILIK